MGELGWAGARGPRRMHVARRLRGRLLKTSAITGGALSALIAVQQTASASCAVASNPNTITCDTTTTSNTTNTDAFNASSSDQIQRFDSFGAVTGTVNASATVNGFGLSVLNQQTGTDGNVAFTNSGTVTATDSSATNALELATSGTVAGNTTVTATNTGTLNGNSNSGAGLSLSGGGSFTVTNTGAIGGKTGISASNVGAFDITTSGTVTGGAGHAIDASVLNGSGGSGAVSVTGGTVSSTAADAIVLNGGASNVTAHVSGGSVTTTADTTRSVVVQTNDGDASINISGGSITAGGANGTGATAASFGAGNTTATMSAGSIAATGDGAAGLAAISLGSGDATVQMTGGTVTASGHSSIGVQAITTSGLVTATIHSSATVNATGPSSTGLFLQSGSSGFVEGFLLGTLSATGAGSLAAEVAGAGGLVVGTGGTRGTLIGNVQLDSTDAQLIFNRSDAITYGGAISGQGGLEIGGGTVSLTGSSTYTNVTAIDSGATLGLKGTGSIVNTSRVEFASCGCGGPATFDISQTTAGASVGGLFDTSGTGVVSLGSQTLTLTGNVGPYIGLITDGGLGGGRGGSIVVQANAVATFGGTNTYTGATTINNGGELDLTGTGSIANSSKVTSNGIFDISGLTNGGTSVTSLAGIGSVALGSNNLTLTNANDNFGGGIAGTGGLVLNGGTQTLSGANTYGGGTTVNAGTLQIGNDNALGTGALSMAAGTTLSFTNLDNFTVANNIQISGDPFFAPPAGTTQTLSGVISDGGSPGVVDMIGAGRLVLTGVNTYTGGTTISAGTLQVTNNSSVGTGNVKLDGGTFQAGTDGLNFNNTFSITANNGSVDTNGKTLTFSNVIANAGAAAGALTKTGTGTLVLTAANTYTGGTTISAGTLQLGNGGTGGSIVGNVLDNGTLAFNRVDPVTFAGAISGSGSVQQIGTGTTVLTASNTYTGGTTVAAGTLQLGTLSTAGNIGGTINVNANGVLNLLNADFSNVTSVTNDGFINISNASTTGPAQITNRSGVEFSDASSAGTGTIANVGLSALLRFFNTSSAAGASINNTGFVQFSDNSSAGTAAITNDQNIAFFNNSTAGAAGITNHSSGLVQFQNTSSADHSTISNAGSLEFTDSSTAANATVINNGLLAFFTSSTAGAASVSNSGDVFFNDDSSAGSASIVSNSDVQFSGNATAANASIVTNSGGAVLFFDNSTGGVAQFTTNTGGLVDFSGTVGPNGDGKLSAGSIAGAGSYYLGGNQLTVGSNNLDTTVSGVISDCGPTGQECDSGAAGGSLVKIGTGTLTLTGVNTYTGSTTIDDGILSVTGSIVSPTLVNSGGTLMGTGSVGTTSVQSGGTLLPGNVGVPGKLTVNGNLAFASGANYVLFFTPSANSKTYASGTAALDGAVFANFASGSRYKAGQYTILTAAGGVSGTFAALNTLGLGAGSGVRNPRLTYDADDVFLVLDPTTISIPSGFTGNQQGVATGINNAILGGANPNDSFNTLLGFAGTQLTNALTQLEGTTPGGATIAGMQLMNGFLSLMLHPSGGPPQQTQGGTGGPIGYAAEQSLLPREVADAYAAAMPVKAPPGQISFAPRWSTWAAAFGGTAHISGQADVGTADTDARAFAVAGGAEYKLSPDTVLGFALAGGGTSWGLSQGLGGGAGDAFQIGGYATHNFGAAYLSGALAYAWHDMHTDRTVTAVGTEQLHAAFRAQGFGGRIEAGYRLATGWIGVTPYGALQVQTFHTPAYSETAQSGPGAFALSYDSRSTTATRTELGAWFDKPYAIAPDRVLSLRGRLAWAHDHSTDPTLNAVFQTLPGSNFTVNATAAPQDLALVSAGAELKFASNWSVSAKFDGEFSGRSQSYAGTGVIKRVW